MCSWEHCKGIQIPFALTTSWACAESTLELYGGPSLLLQTVLLLWKQRSFLSLRCAITSELQHAVAPGPLAGCLRHAPRCSLCFLTYFKPPLHSTLR